MIVLFHFDLVWIKGGAVNLKQVNSVPGRWYKLYLHTEYNARYAYHRLIDNWFGDWWVNYGYQAGGSTARLEDYGINEDQRRRE